MPDRQRSGEAQDNDTDATRRARGPFDRDTAGRRTGHKSRARGFRVRRQTHLTPEALRAAFFLVPFSLALWGLIFWLIFG